MLKIFDRRFRKFSSTLAGNFKLLDSLTLKEQLNIAEKALKFSGFKRTDKCSHYKIDEKFYKIDFSNPQVFYNYNPIEKICSGLIFSKSPYRANLCIVKNYPYAVISLNFEPKCKINKLIFPCYEFRNLSSMLLPDFLKVYNQDL